MEHGNSRGRWDAHRYRLLDFSQPAPRERRASMSFPVRDFRYESIHVRRAKPRSLFDSVPSIGKWDSSSCVTSRCLASPPWWRRCVQCHQIPPKMRMKPAIQRARQLHGQHERYQQQRQQQDSYYAQYQQPQHDQSAFGQLQQKLPYPWQAAVDEASGMTYYHNPQTGTTQWESPPAASSAQYGTTQQSHAQQAQYFHDGMALREHGKFDPRSVTQTYEQWLTEPDQ